VVTHAHPDHIGGAAGAEVLLHAADRVRALRLNAGTIARRLIERGGRALRELRERWH
jgi:glyoxylase-like metal-dependent hydrolase (beta-lactamase superfamily II)